MTDKCTWKLESGNARAWFESPHEGEDSEHPSILNVWQFCPYCGKPIEFEEKS